MYHRDKFAESVKEINQKINKYNFIVPFMKKQMVHYNVDSNIEKVLAHPKDYLPADATSQAVYLANKSIPAAKSEDVKIEWSEVWSNIKQVFKHK